ncbi:hypothetical protein [Amycolatopsis regifaucium]|uniref:Uncharacterized protein n=3 Tax=Amycolatopsis regifaucium TaxID=546365 RepID=A0A154MVL7_9PSEU|nr:hypothetical protein [Amycolatopsis regifaucium]KZB88394.1 hypothetical protein AVL48_18460 [Amycolatopsis regifaucium]OKA04516.1 hypothetical protein ATP06_0232050 [Amycolatopsis regifaucium]SFH51209.1 hypothetical protein SAMN04489731_104552 [Amycolatopsis regifaucium]
MTHPFTPELHGMLLRTAGWLPDDTLTHARGMLAEHRCGDVARLLVFAGRRTTLPLTEDDLDVLGELLQAEGGDPSSLANVELTPDDIPPPWRFSVEWGESGEGGQSEDTNNAMLISALAEQDLLATAIGEPGLRGLWSVVRSPIDDAPYPPPRVVYVAEVDDEHEEASAPAELAGRFQESLIAAGERDPQVEVIPLGTGGGLRYQRAAQENGRLLWAADTDSEVQVARVFDKVDPEAGPMFDPDRPKITDDGERERICEYLESGTLLLVTSVLMDDIVEPERGAMVPTNFYTDGSWVWTDSITYYLREHHLTPDPEFVAYINDIDGSPPIPDTVALGRVMKALTPSADGEPAWTGS